LTYLADTSALAHGHLPAVASRLNDLQSAGLLATCSVVDLELLYGARSGADHRRQVEDRRVMFALAPIEQPTFDRALEVQAELANRGLHRGPGPADLIIAAAAEHAGMTVLHYDKHFDLIAEVTGQPVEWVVERGSV
jgi:hypothetical protein